MLRAVFALVLLFAPARADEEATADVVTSRRHFDAGARAYEEGDFRRALEEFLTAQRLHPVPAFDFNIARCHDKLKQYDDAIALYRRYLSANPPDADWVRKRVTELDQIVQASKPAPPPPKKHTLAIVLGVVGGVVVLGTVVGLGIAFGQPGPDYSPSTLGTTRVTP
jgi:tetratricopeptide (TPR) repeat protein